MSMNTTNKRKILIFGIAAVMVVGITGISMGVYSIILSNLDKGSTGEEMYVRFRDFDEGDILYGDVSIRAIVIGSENYTVSLFANNTLIGSSIPLVWDSTTVADGWWNLTIEIQDLDSERSATDLVLIKIEQPIPPPGVSESGLTTTFSENNGKGNFTIVLDTQPDGNVGIDISSNDISGAVVDGAISGVLTLVFTPFNWNITQTINLTGVNDDISDGDQIFEIALVIEPGVTTDTTGYTAIDPSDITVTVLDDDTSGITVIPDTTIINENYGVANCTIKLDSEPDGEVVINVVSNDVTEAIINDAVNNTLTLTFSAGNWSVPFTVNITGVNDGIPDGENEVYIIIFSDSDATTDTTGYAILPVNIFTVLVQPIYTLIDWEGGDAGWVVSPDNRSVQSTTNALSCVYYTNVPDTIGPITFNEWTTNSDNDFIGCVLGYDPGDIYNGAGTDYMVLYWGGLGHEDLYLRRYINGASSMLANVHIGWTQNVHYQWTVKYSSSRIQLWINSTLRIDTTGTFDTGYFGFYMHSQIDTFFQMVRP